MATKVPNGISIFELEITISMSLSPTKDHESYSMGPSTGTGGKVSSTWVPLYVRNAIVICGTQELNARTPF